MMVVKGYGGDMDDAISLPIFRYSPPFHPIHGYPAAVSSFFQLFLPE